MVTLGRIESLGVAVARGCETPRTRLRPTAHPARVGVLADPVPAPLARSSARGQRQAPSRRLALEAEPPTKAAFAVRPATAEHAADIGAARNADFCWRCSGTRHVVGCLHLTLADISIPQRSSPLRRQGPFGRGRMQSCTRSTRVKHFDCDTKTCQRRGGNHRLRRVHH